MPRSCCIKGCFSDSAVNERGVFEINSGRSEWINIIKKYQDLDINRQHFICGIHFDSDYIKKTNKKTVLRRDAIPSIRISGTSCGTNSPSNESKYTIRDSYSREFLALANENYPIADLRDDEINVTMLGSENFLMEILPDEPTNEILNGEPEMKTITLEEYRRLVLLIPETGKLKNTIKRMENVIRKKDILLKNRRPLTTEQAEVIDCLSNGRRGNKYSENIRKFCLRQEFKSNTAYESLRQFFNKNLPSKRALQLWYTSIDGSPGINQSTLDILHEKAESYQTENNHPLHVTLISDEMKIRKDVAWNNEHEKFVGFSTKTSASHHADQSKPLQVASDALVFLVVGPNFKVPVAYHLLSGLDSIDRAVLTKEVIQSVEETGVKLMSVTSDGLYANISVAVMLGADFKGNKPYIPSPTYPNQKIYIFFDPAHMLKLVRKHFSTGKVYCQNELIDWNLLKLLVERQRRSNFNLCNKLTQHHIDWHHKPMNVRLAAETISRSVADTVEQLKNDSYEEFEGADKTVEFLRNFNDIFDLLNFAENDPTDGKCKQPVRKETAGTVFTITEKLKDYIKHLEYEVESKNRGSTRKAIIGSRAQMGFFGFYIDLISLEGLYNDFVRDGPLEVFYSMQSSQDHLESLFSLFRNRQGGNTNPNAIEFASAFRKLVVCHPLTTCHGSNVIENATKILTISSSTKKPQTSIRSKENIEADINIEIDHEQLVKGEIDSMDSYEEHLWAYIALSVEEKMLKSMRKQKKGCSECLSILLNENEKVNDELLSKKKKEHTQPNKSTMEIVLFSNALMKKINLDTRETSIGVVRKSICNNIDMDTLYVASNFEHIDQNHKAKFVEQAVNTYLVMKSQQIGKRIADEERGAFIRSRNAAATHQRGQ